MKLACDLEADGLDPTQIWCVVCKDLKTKEYYRFVQPQFLSQFPDCYPLDTLPSLVRKAEKMYFHNGIGYDFKVLKKLMGIHLGWPKGVDTLVLSKLRDPKIDGGHSIDAWGRRFKLYKPGHEDWSRFTPEMLHRCTEDTKILEKLVFYLSKELKGSSLESIETEHKQKQILLDQEHNGIYLIKDRALDYMLEFQGKADQIQKDLRELFLPKATNEGEVKLFYKKDGSIGIRNLKRLLAFATKYNIDLSDIAGGDFTLIKFQEFDVSSSKQRIERLLEHGWQPSEYTEKNNPKFTEKSIRETDSDEVKAIGQYMILRNRESTLKGWLDVVDDKSYIHGVCEPLGAWTHRAAHFNPNMGNIAKVVKNEDEAAVLGFEGKFGYELRSCLSIEDTENNVLVGADASSIQLRGLAHFMGDDAYINAVSCGDPHEYNRVLAGIATRSQAKTFIYAWILGAGDWKIGSVIGVDESEIDALYSGFKGKNNRNITPEEYFQYAFKYKGLKPTKLNLARAIKGNKIKTQFLNSTPALKHLKEVIIPRDAKRGYMIQIDGRKLWIPSEYKALAGYLQGFEAIIMKKADVIFTNDLTAKGIWFKQRNWIHDEYQVETRKDYADIVGQSMVNAIVEAGLEYNVKCPLAGEYKTGLNFAETH